MRVSTCKSTDCTRRVWLEGECRPCYRKTLIRLKPKPSAVATARRMAQERKAKYPRYG